MVEIDDCSYAELLQAARLHIRAGNSGIEDAEIADAIADVWLDQAGLASTGYSDDSGQYSQFLTAVSNRVRENQHTEAGTSLYLQPVNLARADGRAAREYFERRAFTSAGEEALLASLEAIPHRALEVFLLRYLEDYAPNEIARMTQIPAEHVSKLLWITRQTLMRLISKQLSKFSRIGE